MITKYVKQHQPCETDAERECLISYLYQIFTREGTTEYALFKQFDAGLHAHKPLSASDRLSGQNISFPISIVFGDRDWMDSRGSKTIISRSKFLLSGQSMLHVLENSGHQMAQDNPEGLAKLLVDDIYGKISFVVQHKQPTVQYVDAQDNVLPEPEDLILLTNSAIKEEHNISEDQIEYIHQFL